MQDVVCIIKYLYNHSHYISHYFIVLIMMILCVCFCNNNLFDVDVIFFHKNILVT